MTLPHLMSGVQLTRHTIINAARIRPVVSQTFPVRDIVRAQANLVAGRHPGKLVLVPSETPT